MTKRGITYLALTIALTIYLLIAVGASRSIASSAPRTAVRIQLSDTDSRFVTPADIAAEIQHITAVTDSIPVSRFPLQATEDYLNSLPNIERANCIRTADDAIQIDIDPMVPVARVFDHNRSYYINREGKRLKASPRYRVNAPVIVGRFDSLLSPVDVIPLIDRVNADEQLRSFVASYEMTPAGDIIIIPNITGHVVNFGDTRDIDNKFRRLRSFYASVMPVKGWDYYDTISVKFAGQVIGRTAPGKRVKHEQTYTDDDFDEIVHPMEDISDNDIDLSVATPTID